MSQTVINETINGVNTERMGATVQAVQQDPALATFRFRASNTRINAHQMFPVYDTIANPVPISISIKTEWPEKA